MGEAGEEAPSGPEIPCACCGITAMRHKCVVCLAPSPYLYRCLCGNSLILGESEFDRWASTLIVRSTHLYNHKTGQYEWREDQ